MSRKIPSAIQEITLNTATYKGATVTPTFINFFFGKNGTGKSTIARAVSTDNGLTWQPGKAHNDYTVLIYNQDFINTNIKSHENLPGVFTINKENIEIESKIKVKSGAKDSLLESRGKLTESKETKDGEISKLHTSFHENCWKKSKVIRDRFVETQKGKKTKALLADEILKVKLPIEHDLAALEVLYETAYGADARVYNTFKVLPSTPLTEIKLLGKPIMSSNDTPFATFISALNATDWVRQGHSQFHTTPDNKCPYCQQALPTDFEQQIMACFDAGYQKDIHTLIKFKEDYKQKADVIYDILKDNLQDSYPRLDLSGYRDKANLFVNTIKLNLQKITDKINEPTSTVVLDDVTSILDELGELIISINGQIQENNDIVNAKHQKQEECKTKVWQHIAYILESDIKNYKSNGYKLQTSISALNTQITSEYTEIKKLTTEITTLNKQVVNTQDAIDGINKLLRDSGFQGFWIREKASKANVYEVIREDGTLAHSLSEGECNFIAFLYFYHLVRGSESADGTIKDKIVVIDDPVSSMDSGALFIVSALVREMLEVCHNNIYYGDDKIHGDYIKQIFILTHNAYFHREVTYHLVRHYKNVSFFLIDKQNNTSTTKLCVRPNPARPSENENYNPVQNAYAALWREYEEVTSPIAILNVIHRILEHYFLQLCGYDGRDIVQHILVDNRDKFVCKVDGSQPDCSQYSLASAMLSYLGTRSNHISDGLDFVDGCENTDQYRATFKMIFELMNQEQHYNMIMGVMNKQQQLFIK